VDPDETFDLLLLAYKESNWQEAIEYAEALLSWLRIGGFPPQVTTGLRAQDLLFDFGDESLNRVASDAIARTILFLAKQEAVRLSN
jgi:hypothetical protein